MIIEFFDVGGASCHDQFQEWRTRHQHGVFLNLATRNRANLHGARCQHLGSGPPYFSSADGFGSLTLKRKVCGSEEELLTWAAENSVRVDRCDHCLRDDLIGSRQEREVTSEIRLPEEVTDGSVFIEGSVQRILVNRYERDPLARLACIAAHGTTCCACGLSFGTVYGAEAEGYIHVHHIRPLSEVGGGRVVNPVEDLRPVCPNCHAVLHLGGRCRTIEEVRQLLRQQRHA